MQPFSCLANWRFRRRPAGDVVSGATRTSRRLQAARPPRYRYLAPGTTIVPQYGDLPAVGGSQNGFFDETLTSSIWMASHYTRPLWQRNPISPLTSRKSSRTAGFSSAAFSTCDNYMTSRVQQRRKSSVRSRRSRALRLFRRLPTARSGRASIFRQR